MIFPIEAFVNRSSNSTFVKKFRRFIEGSASSRHLDEVCEISRLFLKYF